MRHKTSAGVHLNLIPQLDRDVESLEATVL